MQLWGKTLRLIMNRSRRQSVGAALSQPTQPEPLHSRLDAIFEEISRVMGRSKDLVTEKVCVAAVPAQPVYIGLIYMDGLTDTTALQEFVKKSLIQNGPAIQQELSQRPSPAPEFLRNYMAAVGEFKNITDYPGIYDSILSGDAVVILEGQASALSFKTKGGESRGVEEPMSQSVVRGPRDGFTESFGTNVALIRKRLKTPQLWLETRTIGRFSRTTVGFMYINGIVGEQIVQEVRTRLDRIDIDGILESGNIEELIQDETFTPFPMLYNSERPDSIAAGLLEGRVAILVDGTPFVLLAPALFMQFYQSAEDYYQRAEFASLIRILRFVCFFISLLAPSLYIAITTFHQELLPSSLLFSLAAQREGIPFPAFIEAMLMEITFEILREAGVRLPKTVGQAVSIVGALVIGQAAVEAGLVSPAMVIVVAITAISNFVIPSFNMGISLRILRFIMMITGATFGLFGITVGVIAIVQHLCSLRSFGVPYMSPMAPFILADQKDTILRLPLWGLFARPRFISQKNLIRENNPPTKKPERKGSS
ncbi:spore germination protein [Paenibacillus sp. NPDC056579]|uniref:spore germination protein n=1 Tax=Paenibacillus sp. NPDC056579 TaxID=3345871 RepID=UPI0036C3D56E